MAQVVYDYNSIRDNPFMGMMFMRRRFSKLLNFGARCLNGVLMANKCIFFETDESSFRAENP